MNTDIMFSVHLENADTFLCKSNSGKMEVPLAKHDWEKEYQADEFAFNSMIDAGAHSIDVEEAALGVGLFFMLQILTERVIEREKLEASDSHPPAMQRWQRIKVLAKISNRFSPAYNLDDVIANLLSCLR